MEAIHPSPTPALRVWLSGLALVALCVTGLHAGNPAKAPADPGAVEIGAYRLSVPVLHKVEQAIKNFEAMVAANPTLGKNLERLQLVDPKDGSPLSLDKAVAQVGSLPDFKKALASVGLTPREYVDFSFALLGAGLAEFAVSQSGKLPADVPPVLSENVKWLQANRAEFQRFQKEMEKLSAKYEKPSEPSTEEKGAPEPEPDSER